MQAGQSIVSSDSTVSASGDRNRRIPKKKKNENILDYAIRLSDRYIESKDLTERKLKGEFFTPRRVSIFMARLLNVKQDNINLLDPGAGVGTLSAAFCDRLLKSSKRITLTIHAYENDPDLLPLLRNVLDGCKTALEGKGHHFSYDVYASDFVIHNKGYLKEDADTASKGRIFYDYVVSNPPYYKLPRLSPQAVIMRESVFGHPNIYALFMALSARMLKPEGEMVFITPRSFCSGLHYRKFRRWFLEEVSIEHIHVFESRKGVFDKDDVLQENIIIKARKSDENHNCIRITTSKSKSLERLKATRVSLEDVIFNKNGDTFVRIPSSQRDVRIQCLVDAWPNTLKDLGFEVSTGPVVVFRTRENLLNEQEYAHKEKEVLNVAPLLWMHNLQRMKIIWPLRKHKKPSFIEINRRSKSILRPVRNYVLVRRFSSKEQKRRLYAAALLRKDFPFGFVGIENHVNYIHRINGELTISETLGLAGLLSTTLIDDYFRTLNGNSQVNATDIKCLPLPDIRYIREIGEHISEESFDCIDFDKMTSRVLNIDCALMESGR